jgi:hypothetical protein
MQGRRVVDPCKRVQVLAKAESLEDNRSDRRVGGV